MAEKVMIVDDDAQTLRLVGLMLERQGYRILSANSGSQAIQIAHNEIPDIIVLDIMMPDLDGYEVARRLRKDPETTNIPILAFTARAQVEDKVNGYEAGVDDYLTKPIHPAELTAHLRSLLARSKARSAVLKESGYTIGVLAPKGGLGVSTLTLNLALAFHQKTKVDVIAAEMRPGQGTWGIELGYPKADGLGRLLRMRSTDISVVNVENELNTTNYGIRLLCASPRFQDSELMGASEQIEVIATNLPFLARLVMLDLGTPCIPGFETLLNHCNELIVVTEPFPGTIQRTRLMIDDLNARGFGHTKLLTVVSINRMRTDIQLSLAQIQEMLGVSVSQVIPPAPEIAFQAGNRHIPFIMVQTSDATNQQYLGLAERLIQRVLAA